MAETPLQKAEAAPLAHAEEAKGVTVTPRVDILETDDELLLLVDMPGVDPAHLVVRFEDGELLLHGRRTPRFAQRPWLWEYETGSFFRSFRVSEKVAPDRISAELKNGVLTLHLPKAEAARPRKIAVKGQ